MEKNEEECGKVICYMINTSDNHEDGKIYYCAYPIPESCVEELIICYIKSHIRDNIKFIGWKTINNGVGIYHPDEEILVCTFKNIL